MSELGAGARGGSLGFDALRIAAIDLKSDFFYDKDFIDIPHHYADFFAVPSSEFLKNAPAIHACCKAVSLCVEQQAHKANTIFACTGDHSTSVGIAAGLRKAHPQKPLGIIWIDAHLDLHSPLTSPSGNIHGMPICIMLREDNVAEAVRTLDDKTSRHWQELKSIYRPTEPCIQFENIVYLGIRSYEYAERQLVKQKHIPAYSVETIRQQGIVAILQSIQKHLAHCEQVYLSFDVDCLDSKISYGTGTPERDGFTVHEVEQLFEHIIPALSNKLTCFEVTELNPTLDCKNNTAEITLKLIEKVYLMLNA